jgi:hypothetical protein
MLANRLDSQPRTKDDDDDEDDGGDHPQPIYRAT